MGKRKRNVSFSNEFFKVYLSDFSYRQLSLPPAFVVQFNGKDGRTLPKNDVALKDYNGKIWNVRLVREENDLIIRDGWKDFADCHSVVDGDFLIFKYDGSSQFDVELYGINGLKKNGKGVDNTNMGGSTFVKVKEEQGPEEEFVDCRPGSGSKPRDSEIEPRRTRSHGLSGGNDSKSNKTNATKPGECNLTKAPSVTRNWARFVVTITKTSRSVRIPKSLLRKYDIEMPKALKLRDEGRKSWPVQISFGGNGCVAITHGWSEFLRSKKLAPKDQCAFGFILTKGNVCNAMRVQVVRRGARTLKRGSAWKLRA